MSFNTIENKDQLRLLKTSVQSKLRSTFKPRYRGRSGSATTLSSTDSECNTLVNFDFDSYYSECSVEEEDDTPHDQLDAENSAWSRGRPKHVPTPQKSTPVARQPSAFQAEMIEDEDAAWNRPRKVMKNSRGSGLFSAIAGRHHQKKGPQGSNWAQELEPEDRAWM